MQPSNPGSVDAQIGFVTALLDPDLPVPEGIIGPRGKAAGKRFAVYRNNVTVSLVNALADIFPAVARLVGEGFFRNMARVYLAEEPPRSALLFEYGHGFPAFLETFEPVGKLSYLPDVARLERAWLDAFHAADADPLPPASLGAVAPEDLGRLCFAPHPATRIIESRFAAVSIFSASRSGQTLENIRALEEEAGLITRPGHEVQVRQLPPGAAAFFMDMIDGRPLGDAATGAFDRHPDFDLPSAISAMIESGAFVACQIDNQPTGENLS